MEPTVDMPKTRSNRVRQQMKHCLFSASLVTTVCCILALQLVAVESKTTCFASELRPDAPLTCAPYKVFDIQCPICGDGVCDLSERCERCPADCSDADRCQSMSSKRSSIGCGNGVCEFAHGETCKNCVIDCGPCVFPGPYRFCEPRDPPVMALTFDDGPTETTPLVLDLLKEYGAKATFFNIASHAFNPLVERILREGHVIAGHTYSHTELTDMSEEYVLNDTLVAAKALEEFAGKVPKYMRPPFGRFSWSTLKAFENIGTKNIIWSGGVWPETPKAVVRSANNSMLSGRSTIFMFHGEKNSTGAMHADMTTLRTILDTAKQHNVQLVNMTECLGDYNDGAWKSLSGTCVDDGCLCSGQSVGLPVTAPDVCYSGDISSIVHHIQSYHPQIPDQCHHNPENMNRADLLQYEHYWYSHEMSDHERTTAKLLAGASKSEVTRLQRDLVDCHSKSESSKHILDVRERRSMLNSTLQTNDETSKLLQVQCSVSDTAAESEILRKQLRMYQFICFSFAVGYLIISFTNIKIPLGVTVGCILGLFMYSIEM